MVMSRHTSPLYLICFKIPTKAMPLSDSHIRVTTMLSQRVVYFANETKDCDPPPIENRCFLELMAPASVISDTACLPLKKFTDSRSILRGILPIIACEGRLRPKGVSPSWKVGFSLDEVYKREGKFVILVCKKAQNGWQMYLKNLVLWFIQSEFI